MKITDVVFREDLYPRFEPSQSTIQKYAYSIEHLPPIKVNQNNILIDGFHRLKAHQLNGETEIKSEVIETVSEKELKKLAYQLNANHGLQLDNKEKRQYAIEMIDEMTVKELSDVLSVSQESIAKWTKDKRESLEEDRNRKIVEMYLRASNTQQSIADVFGLTQNAIKEIINKHISKFTEMFNSFKPFLYNIWNVSKQDVQTDSHFGAFPKIFMDNLLHYHTEPFDIIYDPFAGGGTTVDSCKDMLRRYYCTDLEVKPGREKDILQHDITLGLPEGLPKPKMLFLDPPYWKQAEGKYTDQPTDFSNMTLEDFNNSMASLLELFTKWKVERIALVIQSTQYKNNWIWTDHAIDANNMIKEHYDIEMRYVLPYSTEQYMPQMVIKAKEDVKCLSTFRDLIIWKIKK